jgi:pilus assembly protein CpaE
MDSHPDVILIDADDAALAIESAQVLNAAIPGAWILVSTPIKDTQTILDVIRAGAREFIPRPATQESLAQALRRHVDEHDRLRKSEANINGKVYSVCSAKSGTGATTVAINLAASMAEMENSRACLVDLDRPIGDIATYLNITPRYTISDTLKAASRLDSVLLESYMLSHEKVSVLAGLEEFETLESAPAQALTQLFEAICATYTHTVVDLPLSFTPEQIHVVTAMSSTIVVVLTPDLPSLRRTDRLLRFFSTFEDADKIRLVVNRSRKADEITERDIERALKHPVAWKLPNEYSACMDAINHGKTLLSGSSKTLARNFRDFTRHLMGIQIEEKRKGLLSLLPKATSY